MQEGVRDQATLTVNSSQFHARSILVPSEAQIALSQLEGTRFECLEALMQEFDEDQDGKVSAREFRVRFSEWLEGFSTGFRAVSEAFNEWVEVAKTL